MKYQNAVPSPSAMRTTLGWGILAVLLSTGAGRLGAQQSTLLSGFNPVGDRASGLQLYSITGFGGWESIVNPQGGLYQANANLKGDETYGGSLSAGWSRRNKKFTLAIQYSASYLAQVRYSNLSALNHFLMLSASRRLGPKWSLGFAGSSAISTYDQMLFDPTIFSSLAAFSGTFDDLAAAVLAGKYNNDQLASLLTGAQVIESPSRSLLLGSRLFTASASTSLGYTPSQRLSFSFSSSASQSQHLNDHGESGIPQSVYLTPRAREITATIGLSYALTPRTQVGVTATSSRGFSEIQQAYTTSGMASIGRTIGRRWFAQVHAGSGFVTSLRSQYQATLGTMPIYGMSLGLKTRAYSFLVSGDRSLGQTYGVGAADTITTNAAWQWWRPGRNWGLSSNYMGQRSRGGVFGRVDGWRAAAGITRRVGRRAVLETAYTYASYSTTSILSPFDSTQHAVRVSVMWTPQGQERR